jgi:hypothetical protein
MRHDTDAVRDHHRVDPRACSLHAKRAFPYSDLDLRQAQSLLQDRLLRYLTRGDPKTIKQSG